MPSIDAQTILGTLDIHLFTVEARYTRNHSYLTVHLISKRTEVDYIHRRIKKNK